MKNVLIIDATISKNSRTLRLCNAYVDKYYRDNFSVSRLKLSEENLAPLTTESLEKRDSLIRAKQTNPDFFSHAHTFATADAIVIAAPYYDLSFPASVKVYIENIMVNGITFCYGDRGPEGLCKAKELIYVTTAGGSIGTMNFGYEYVKGLAKMVGISETKCILVEGLDMMGNDAEKILSDGIASI